ncbi:MAG: dihydrodipicolinate synthase family protein [Chloroflexaceae bacterium]|jgi:4-hydroxy-tetrahydrodipicolinate synthase|nr:dihydrodipicolinate synthase family protein [Chloroflexaceae bacterium]
MPELHAAIVTPLDATNRLDTNAMQQLMRHLAQHGLDGVVPCGTTGEGPSFSVQERLEIIKSTIAARGHLQIIAGTGCQALSDTVALTRAAIDAGADAALVLPPFFYKQSGDAGVIAWYRAVCDALPAHGKIILYHIPPMTGVAITVPIIEALCRSHPEQILGIKDSGVDAAHTAMLVASFPHLKIYTGNAPILAQAIRDGAAGSILAIANIVPRALRILSDAPHRTDIQTQVAQVDAYVRKVGAASTIKAIITASGVAQVGAPRLPQLAHPDPKLAYQAFKQIGEYTV